MNKKRNYLVTSLSLLFFFISLPTLAEGIPIGEYDQEIDPPPTTPIDDNLFVMIVISFLFVGYFLYKNHRTTSFTKK